MSYVAVGCCVVSVGASLFGASSARKEAEKQRQLMWNMKMAELAQNEKLTLEQIRTTNETERIRILSDSLLKYREALQKESTIRLRDTWIYVASLGCGTGLLYAISLMFSKSASSGKA
jgi:hypothetical protein